MLHSDDSTRFFNCGIDKLVISELGIEEVITIQSSSLSVDNFKFPLSSQHRNEHVMHNFIYFL